MSAKGLETVHDSAGLTDCIAVRKFTHRLTLRALSLTNVWPPLTARLGLHRSPSAEMIGSHDVCGEIAHKGQLIKRTCNVGARTRYFGARIISVLLESCIAASKENT